ncbi:aminotransferase class I/II-fold pyridoxal phosphate-dependent enzyme [Altererythrobacter soli]|uniref:Aminotransferase class I/II-fold pyridoxal phosphate-dependent enzyme n=2 Tax=Croceibacterium soli TaxID=1739690 RepID=A0A6I4UUK2_9SPHN|nr:aminotransferase class I/II-fold pyridoxal phosphate-dependent enzyme [Croceibacterium soli]
MDHADSTRPASRTLTRLTAQPPDAILELISLHAQDERERKIDLGVGVYRDEAGVTPVFAAVKAAEDRLLRSQTTKSYLGPEGDIEFFRRLLPLALGSDVAAERVAGMQTPGGTGALRIGAELIAAANPNARVHVGAPTWPNHAPIFAAARLELVEHPYLDPANQTVRFGDMMAALEKAAARDVVLLHGCCHNPTGADLDAVQWQAVARLCAERGLLPFIDFAYHGLGDGLEADRQGLACVARHCPEAIVAYSCDKNFGLYRERVGALFVLAADRSDAALAQSNLLSLARANWSMPPDHGAAIVRLILEREELSALWREELENMRRRIAAMREGLARLDPALAFLTRQKGMFSTLDLTPRQVAALREEHAVYVAGTGRINIAGLAPHDLQAFAAALAAVR